MCERCAHHVHLFSDGGRAQYEGLSWQGSLWLARDRGRIAVLPGIDGRNIIVASPNIIVMK